MIRLLTFFAGALGLAACTGSVPGGSQLPKLDGSQLTGVKVEAKDVSGLGTAAQKSAGEGAGELLVLDAAGKVPVSAINASVGAQLVNLRAGISGSSRGLVVANSSSGNLQLDVSFDELVLKDGNGAAVASMSGAFTLDLSVVGVNGLDSGSRAPSTWYYYYAISNGTTVAGLVSTLPTITNLPTGYSYKARLGAIRTAADNSLPNHHQVGNQIYHVAAVAATGAFTTWTPVTIATQVPPAAKLAFGYIYCSPTSGVVGLIGGVCLAGLAAGFQQIAGQFRYDDSSKDYVIDNSAGVIPLKTPQTVWLFTTVNGIMNLIITGYSLE